MNILIDKEPLEFTLEEEKTVGEVVQQLEQFLLRHELVICEIRADDSMLSLDDESWKTTELSSVSSLDIRTEPVEAADSPPMGRAVEELTTILEYLSLYEQALKLEEETALRDLASEYQHVAPALPELIGIRLPTNDPSSLKTLTEAFLSAEEPQKSELKAQFLEFLKHLSLITHSRMQERLCPVEEIVASREHMRTLLPRLSEVSVLLQAGKDAEAMQYVAQFTELAAKVLRLIPQVEHRINTEGLHDFAVAYHSIVGELMSAFSARDSVLIGDLLEYEITPYSEELIKRLDSILVHNTP